MDNDHVIILDIKIWYTLRNVIQPIMSSPISARDRLDYGSTFRSKRPWPRLFHAPPPQAQRQTRSCFLRHEGHSLASTRESLVSARLDNPEQLRRVMPPVADYHHIVSERTETTSLGLP